MVTKMIAGMSRAARMMSSMVERVSRPFAILRDADDAA
jgi:hypothetical protein